MLGKLRFSPGSLVLVRYSTYPIWPGTVQRNYTPGYNRFVDVHPNREGDEVVAYWVVFSGDQEGGWVPANNVVPYHPDLVYLARVSESNGWHGHQTNALCVAGRQYQALFPDRRKRQTVSLADRQSLSRILEMYHCDDDQTDVIVMRPADDEDDDYADKDYDVDEDADDDQGRHRRSPSPVRSMQTRPSKAESPTVKAEPELMDALTYHPPKSSIRRRRKSRTVNTTSRRRAPRRAARNSITASTLQEIADLRECLRRRNAQIVELNKEARVMRATRTSQLRQSFQQRQEEKERLRREIRELRTGRMIAPTSRIPTLEQWHRATNPASFRQAAGRLQNKYTAFCGGVKKYARALEELREARAALSVAYQHLREETQMTENDIIDAEKALSAFGDILKGVRFDSESDGTVIICD